MSNATQCAKLIRAELKKEFPTTKFNVTSDTSGESSAVYINYTDGAMYSAVSAIADKYNEQEYSHRSDSFILSANPHNLEHRTGCVLVNRFMSLDARAVIADKLINERFRRLTADFFMIRQSFEYDNRSFNTSDEVSRMFSKTAFN